MCFVIVDLSEDPHEALRMIEDMIMNNEDGKVVAQCRVSTDKATVNES